METAADLCSPRRENMAPDSRCRFCDARLQHTFLDLGATPLANSFVPPDRVGAAEPFFALQAFVCDQCYLVQTRDVTGAAEIF